MDRSIQCFFNQSLIGDGCLPTRNRTITNPSGPVTSFVRDVRTARSDLEEVSREPLPGDAAVPAGKGFPETLKTQIIGISSDCSRDVIEIEQTPKNHESPGLKKVRAIGLVRKGRRGEVDILLRSTQVRSGDCAGYDESVGDTRTFVPLWLQIANDNC